jgi:hypothetical protein
MNDIWESLHSFIFTFYLRLCTIYVPTSAFLKSAFTTSNIMTVSHLSLTQASTPSDSFLSKYKRQRNYILLICSMVWIRFKWFPRVCVLKARCPVWWCWLIELKRRGQEGGPWVTRGSVLRKDPASSCERIIRRRLSLVATPSPAFYLVMGFLISSSPTQSCHDAICHHQSWANAGIMSLNSQNSELNKPLFFMKIACLRYFVTIMQNTNVL